MRLIHPTRGEGGRGPAQGRARRTARRRGGKRPSAALFDRAVGEFFMRVALKEAARGMGRTSPNPAVGAVLVKNGRVIARGHHAKAGGPHAEVVALRAAGARAKGADLYTTLEPCDHWGRTPPCSLAVLAAGVRRVFVGSRDPNPKVNGRGLRRLERAGVPVVTGVLTAECDALNAPWFHFITTGLPFVTLKAAITADGKLATATGDSRWVSGEAARRMVHELRDKVDAVLVGSGTVRADDPRLTTRLPRGRGRDPVRVVLDSHLALSPRRRVFRQPSTARTLLAYTSGTPRRYGPNVELVRCGARGGRVDLADLLAKLARRDVAHLLVEGGAEVFGAFLERGLADRVMLFVAPKIVGGGGRSWVGGKGAARMADALALDGLEVSKVGDDILLTGSPRRRVAPARRRR